MEKLKIVINGDENIAKKAKECFAFLGYHISSENRNNCYGWSLGEREGDYYGSVTRFNLDAAKLLTIDGLRDLVVLKRNLIDDATHVDQYGDKWRRINNKFYFYSGVGEWDDSLSHLMNRYELKPIEKPMKEYLRKKSNGTYSYIGTVRPEHVVDFMIEIPEGCNIVTCENRMGNFVYFHWKSLDSDEFFLKDEKIWSNNFNETLSDFIERNGGDVNIIWQRHTQPEELPFIDDEPSLNNQYAEIEKVRQSEKVLKEILEGNLPEFDFEAIDAFIESNVEQDNVNQPVHYCSHPSGIECIEITRHHDFAIGNAIKYLWRAGLKDSSNEIQDLEKSIWYIQDKINQLKKQNENSCKD